MHQQRVNFLGFALCLFFALPVLVASAVAQQQPLNQRSTSVPPPPVPVLPVPQINEPFPALSDDISSFEDEASFLSNRGVLVETLDGRTVVQEFPDQQFNPASAIKLATALAALRTFGPQHRFSTVVWTNGTFDQATNTITGDLIISGRDPSFHYEHAVMIARELNRQGIRTVTGDLIIAPRFTMNYSSSALRSGERFYDTLDATRRPSVATRAWYEERQALGDTASLQTLPSVAVMGAVYVDSVPAGARQLLTHRSSTLIDILKVLLCYSNNFMADRLGDSLGGPQGVRRLLISTAGVNPSEVTLASTSGLGINRMTPRAMMKTYRALLSELANHRLSPSDIMPVAGIDPGTLQKRFTAYPSRGSVIAKTGTLPRSDGGVSTLVGQTLAKNGETLLFVIFNQRGNVVRFRREQEELVTQWQNVRGGPAPFAYTPFTLAMRLANTELDAARSSLTNEYEPAAN